MPASHTRRTFLQIAPLAAASLPLPLLHASTAASQAPQTNPTPPARPEFQLFTAQSIESTERSLQARPGVKELVPGKDLALLMNVTVEAQKAAAEFEFHEHRDHIFQILDGSTRYELGGTPITPRQTRPGEWLAPRSEGCRSVTLSQGDFLMIPRMTPHRRITDHQVTFILITGTTPA